MSVGFDGAASAHQRFVIHELGQAVSASSVEVKALNIHTMDGSKTSR